MLLGSSMLATFLLVGSTGPAHAVGGLQQDLQTDQTTDNAINILYICHTTN